MKKRLKIKKQLILNQEKKLLTKKLARNSSLNLSGALGNFVDKRNGYFIESIWLIYIANVPGIGNNKKPGEGMLRHQFLYKR